MSLMEQELQENLNTMLCKVGQQVTTNTTSGGAILLSPIPDTTYVYKIHYNAIPTKLEASSNETNFISLNFPNGLLYAVVGRSIWLFKRSCRYVTTV